MFETLGLVNWQQLKQLWFISRHNLRIYAKRLKCMQKLGTVSHLAEIRHTQKNPIYSDKAG
jgi:hypothetical protein